MMKICKCGCCDFVFYDVSAPFFCPSCGAILDGIARTTADVYEFPKKHPHIRKAQRPASAAESGVSLAVS